MLATANQARGGGADDAALRAAMTACERHSDIRTLHDQFVDEQRDPTWAAATEANLSTLLNTSDETSALPILSLECQHERCELFTPEFGCATGKSLSAVLGVRRREPWWHFGILSLAKLSEGNEAMCLAILSGPS